MRCLARTRTLKRCTRSTRFLVCKNHIFQLLVFSSVIITVALLIYSPLYQNVIKPLTHKKQYFDAQLIGSLTFPPSRLSQKRISPLLYFYTDQNHLYAGPVDIAVYVKVESLKPASPKVLNYNVQASIEYKVNNDRKETTCPLISLPLRSKRDVFFIKNSDWTRAVRMEFPGFEIQAENAQLRQGESVSGWMLFEMDRDCRGMDYTIKRIILNLENDTHRSESIPLNITKESKKGGLKMFADSISPAPPSNLIKLNPTIAFLQDIMTGRNVE
jgi:hypothetical protein